MKNLIWAILLSPFLVACKNEKGGTGQDEPAKKDSLLITEHSWGLIDEDTDLEKLQDLFGTEVVPDSMIFGPEGLDTLMVTFVHPGNSKELVVHWKDSFYHKKIGFVESYRDNSPYRTEKDLKIGSTFRKLLEVNGRPVNFTEFGWDYGGYIMSYNKGSLDSSHITFRLTSTEELPNELYGDTELSTDNPLVQQNLDKIRVYWIMLNFHEH